MSHALGLNTTHLLEVIPHLPASEIVRLREVCHDIKRLIDSSAPLQARISYLFLEKMFHKANIPLSDLHYSLHNDRLALEIHRDLSLHHLTSDLGRVLPWISHLTVKNCEGETLNLVFERTLGSPQLKTLFLCDCTLNGESLSVIKKFVEQNPTPPNLYLCNVSLPEEIPHFPEKLIHFIEPSKANLYSLDRFPKKVKGIAAVRNFEMQVTTPEASSENVIIAFNLIPDLLRRKIAENVWRMVLMNPWSSMTGISRIDIEQSALNYIKGHPHHPAVCAAIASEVGELIDSKF